MASSSHPAGGFSAPSLLPVPSPGRERPALASPSGQAPQNSNPSGTVRAGRPVQFNHLSKRSTMSSSPNGARYSGGSSQRQFKHARREIESYKANVYELERLFLACPDLRRTHFDIAGDVEDTITRTLGALKEAETLVDKDMSQTTIMRWVGEAFSSLRPPLKDCENLKQRMEENNRQVETLSRRIERITASQPAHEYGRSSFDLFNPPIDMKPPIERTIPFTEPYDEDLCEFETVDSRVWFYHG